MLFSHLACDEDREVLEEGWQIQEQQSSYSQINHEDHDLQLIMVLFGQK